jgi:hypothetical protein
MTVERATHAWPSDSAFDEAAEKVAAYAERGVDGIIGVLPGSRQRPQSIEAYGELAAQL